jgi:hypothetical protein
LALLVLGLAGLEPRLEDEPPMSLAPRLEVESLRLDPALLKLTPPFTSQLIWAFCAHWLLLFPLDTTILFLSVGLIILRTLFISRTEALNHSPD